MNYKSCPISADLVNAKLTRIYAIVTFLAISIFLFTSFKAIIFFSTTDFIIRIFFGVKYSPICFLIRNGLKLTKVETHMVNAGPKKFAAKIGLIFTSLMSLGVLLNLPLFTTIVAGITFIAVGSEAIFGFCVACFLYQYIPKNWK